ncbi:hypothetical protein K432DRAFT_214355 [Lepidopterella palustris CBS 459.81]|uniref:Secreted protein n=1 Tax=Lepidopterella palustris CBS 459.81 TaxID=1314670 RepID=A0A8E2EEN1_9PEZI|nr:hypothetical protein K432DRAFT_214355 [Lepidopterella palustris CBS 459.81]
MFRGCWAAAKNGRHAGSRRRAGVCWGLLSLPLFSLSTGRPWGLRQRRCEESLRIGIGLLNLSFESLCGVVVGIKLIFGWSIRGYEKARNPSGCAPTLLNV